ncbi:hypothetical protein GH714_034599 [Hevea brasiliensis]|uniref:STAS domain-containing protein n=1 Tax=Hevea brasiliensis TaxID=3981 RepID=A0A6A6NCR3_HEVBR|nr:hypothetical protein GH714_034599 [Hevea brasiliensis]
MKLLSESPLKQCHPRRYTVCVCPKNHPPETEAKAWSDIISGLTIASLAIPQGISYAKLANLPPIVGLYSSFVPPLIYSILGSSRHLAVGPVSIASLVMGSMLSEAVSPTEDQILYLKLAFTATFFAGVFQASLGLLRLGFVIDFLSKATLVGFMAGAAIIVSLQQLKGLLGIVHFTSKMQFVPVMSSVFNNRDESMKKPKLFWVSAAAPLTSVIVSTLLVFCLKSKIHRVSIIGHLPEGLNPPSANMLYFKGDYLAVAIKTGIVTGILSLTEGIAVGRTFAALKTTKLMDHFRSAVNYNAGAQTAVSNIVLASAVLVTLLFLMPLFYYTPNVILAAIIITAVIGLIDYRAAYQLWKVDKLDFLACLCSFFGVLFISVPLGLAIADIKMGSRGRREIKSNNGSTLKCIILDMTAVTAIDTSGIELVCELRKMLEKRSLQLVLANPVGSVMEKLQQSKVLESFGLNGLYLTVGEAVADISALWKSQP